MYIIYNSVLKKKKTPIITRFGLFFVRLIQYVSILGRGNVQTARVSCVCVCSSSLYCRRAFVVTELTASYTYLSVSVYRAWPGRGVNAHPRRSAPNLCAHRKMRDHVSKILKSPSYAVFFSSIEIVTAVFEIYSTKSRRIIVRDPETRVTRII